MVVVMERPRQICAKVSNAVYLKFECHGPPVQVHSPGAVSQLEQSVPKYRIYSCLSGNKSSTQKTIAGTRSADGPTVWE